MVNSAAVNDCGAPRRNRIRSLLRRAAPAGQPTGASARSPRLRFGDLEDLEFCPVSLTAHRDGKPLALTTTELKLLSEFAASPGTVLSGDLLLERVWDYESGSRRREPIRPVSPAVHAR
jgi:DNA-binding response OmpR family regulator